MTLKARLPRGVPAINAYLALTFVAKDSYPFTVRACTRQRPQPPTLFIFADQGRTHFFNVINRVMVILVFFIVHWYVSLFFQSVFLHRYAAHGIFTMSKRMERLFFIGCALSQGSSYISARAYGMMHRLHHAHTDTPLDPHAPDNSGNVLAMMWQTRNNYYHIYIGRTAVEEKYTHNLPRWDAFDRIVHHPVARLAWVLIYTAFYIIFATAWWQFLLLPLTIVMGPLHGVAVNWWAHRFGYSNFDNKDQSKNILPVDVLFFGEAFHNNHHKHPGRANNAYRWFEIDSGYLAMRLMHSLGMIRLKERAGR